jgi:transcriptional regulator with XRE-family HTH domain
MNAGGVEARRQLCHTCGTRIGLAGEHGALRRQRQREFDVGEVDHIDLERTALAARVTQSATTGPNRPSRTLPMMIATLLVSFMSTTLRRTVTPSQTGPRLALAGPPSDVPPAKTRGKVVSVSTPLGDFLRARRDATSPEALGVPAGDRRRVPGLRRSELASLAGISVEYLVRIEQGRDHNPSISVVNALADALRLDASEREQLRHLAKRASNTCFGGLPRPQVEVRSNVRAILTRLEPGIALISNRLGDILVYTRGFDLLARPTGLLDEPRPNITRYVFTDDR